MFSQKITHSLYLLILAVLFLPFFQEQTNWFSLKPLKGHIETVPKPAWEMKKWFTENLQQEFQAYVTSRLGFRTLLIRINNQLDFSLFKTPHANEVIVGKNDYLFENNYIKDYTGEDFIGEEQLDERLARLRFIQQALKQKNIDLLVIFSPGKASFYPEYIPDRYHPEKRAISNYQYFSSGAAELGLNTIDFNQYFIQMKDTVSWPIYPKCGIHWSVYGMALCADSLFRYIEKTRGIRMLDFGWNGLDLPDTLRDTDYDIGDGMNLLWKIKTPRGAYPRFFYKEQPGYTKPDVLVIADSFYWTIFGNGITSTMFGENVFWFYFEQAFTSKGGPFDVKTLDVKAELESKQMIILMSAESNLFKFPFGFLEKVYPLYFPDKQEEQLEAFRNLIRWDKGWFETVKKIADNTKTNLDQQIEAEAKLTLLYRDSLTITDKELKTIIAGIRSNPDWMAGERKKAGERNITLDQQLKEDATWIFTMQSKNYRRKYWPK